jgi:transcriptional regulator with XRE-family HTH domain
MTPAKVKGTGDDGSVLEAGLSARPLPAEADILIGRLLGDARQDAGISQTVAAQALKAAQSRIAKLERGRRRLLFAEAILLADLYGVPLERFDPRVTEPRPGPTARRERVDRPGAGRRSGRRGAKPS